MFKKIFSLRKHELVRGSFILLIMINIFNLLNYFFHFFMARMLGPADYGILAVLMSIAYIFTVPIEGIQAVISRYTSKFNVKKENRKIKYLLFKSLKKSLAFSFLLFLIYIPISFFISSLIGINVGLVLYVGILIFGIFLIPLTRGVMQGTKRFKQLGWNMIAEGAIKLIIAISLVYSGLRVYGAVGGVILGLLLTLVLSFIFIKDILKTKIEKIKIEGIYSYGIPVLLAILSITLMMSLDIIFAKRYFSPEIAGKYAVASMLGKIIFFGTQGISKAMFPLASEGHDNGDQTKGLFKKSFFIVAALCLFAVIIYAFFPKLIISILFGSQYLEVAGILVFVAGALSLASINNLSLLYACSIKKKKLAFFLIFVFIQIIIFEMFHKTLTQFSLGFLIANLLMSLSLMVFIKLK